MSCSALPAGKDVCGTFHWVSSCSQAAVSELTADPGDRPSSGRQVLCCHGTHNGCRLACLGFLNGHSFTSASAHCLTGSVCACVCVCVCGGQRVGIGCFLFYSGRIVL